MMKLSSEAIQQELTVIVLKFLSESGQPYTRNINFTTPLQKLGIDSLARAELFRRIEKQLSVTLPDHLLSEVDTLEDLANYLESNPSSFIELRPKEIKKREVIHHESIPILQAETLQDVLRLYGEVAKDQPHIYFQKEDGKEEIITYGQLLNSALRVANALQHWGLKSGETVAIMQPTHPNFFYIFMGTLMAGGVPVPIYPPFRMHMLEAYTQTEAKILKNAGVRLLVTFKEAEKLSLLLKTFVPNLKTVTTAEELLKAEPWNNGFVSKKEHYAFIQYTSGSTNEPKGVSLTHSNLLTNIRAYGKAIQVTPQDVTVSWLPLYHDMGLIGMWMGSLYFGIPLVLLTPFSFLNRLERWLWAIHYYRGTLSGAPNFAYELCARKIDPGAIEGLDLSSWRVAANGAEKIYPATLEQFAKRFAPYGFKKQALLPVYGLAESTVALAIPPINQDFLVDYVDRDQFETKKVAMPAKEQVNALPFVSCGKPIEGHEIRIVNDDNQLLPERSVGNLQFTGPSSMQGYFHNAKATEAVMHDGWIDSGDLAYLAEGNVYITGRRKDLIIKAGRNLYPAEIEEIIGHIAGIRLGCVIAFGVNDEEMGSEKLVVIAETRERSQPEKDRIKEEIREQMVAKLDITPDEVILVPPHHVPKTSSGKLQRSAGKKLYLQKTLQKSAVPAWLQIIKLSCKSLWFTLKKSLLQLGKIIYSLYVGLIFSVSFAFLYVLVFVSSTDFSAVLCKQFAKMILFLAFCPLRMNHQEKLLKENPVIYVSNHASFVDAVVVLAVLPAGTRFVAKKEIFTNFFLRMLLKKLNVLPVSRLDLSKGLEEAEQIKHTLQAGKSIMIFPEGTFGPSPGLRPFRLGAFKLAADLNLPICPVTIQGTRKILPADSILFSPHSIRIVVSDAVWPAGSDWQDVTHLREVVRALVAKFCGEPSLDYIAAEKIAPRLPSSSI